MSVLCEESARRASHLSNLLTSHGPSQIPEDVPGGDVFCTLSICIKKSVSSGLSKKVGAHTCPNLTSHGSMQITEEVPGGDGGNAGSFCVCLSCMVQLRADRLLGKPGYVLFRRRSPDYSLPDVADAHPRISARW